jgi:dephospho-CoA kinase
VIVLGLTGGIGMGKTTAAQMFRRMGVPVHDSDRAVHRALAQGGAAVIAVARAFPEAARAGWIDRGALGRRVFGDPAALRRLERILHPLVRRSEGRFLREMRGRRAPLVVLDIPLLFETASEKRCDAVIVVTAPPFLQRARVLARPAMNAAIFASVLARQLPDPYRRRRAHFVVPSGLGRAVTFRYLRRIVRRYRKIEKD